MSAFRAWLGVIADLIGLQAKARGFFRSGQIKPRRIILWRQRKGAAAIERFKLRARFNGQLIKREMIRRECQSLTQFRPPGSFLLARARIDQIKGKARENTARGFQCGNRLRHIMLAAKKAQRFGIQGLHAKACAIDAGLPKCRKLRCLHAGWVGFQRDFDIG